MGVVSVRDIAVALEAPTGWIKLGRWIRDTNKAVLFDVDGTSLWFPKKTVRIWEGAHYAPPFAVKTAIDYARGKPHA